jgi:NADH dehydrogenase
MPDLPIDSLITVIGGSGFIGRYVVQMLAERGYRLRVVVRNAQAGLFLKPLGGLGQIEVSGGDIRSDADMARAFHGASAGVNLVGILAETGGRTFQAVQAEGAARAARAAAAAGIARYVQVSAIGADPASPSAYGRSKAEGEAAVRAALPASAILRPSIVFGPEDQFFNRFAQMAALAPAMPVIAGNTRFQPVYVANVAEAVTAALTDGAVAGQTLELGGPRDYSFRDLLKLILRETGRDLPLVEVPDSVARLMGRLGDLLPFVPMTSDQFAMLQRDNVCAPGMPGLAQLGIVPTPVEAIIPAQLQRFRKGGRFAANPALGAAN